MASKTKPPNLPGFSPAVWMLMEIASRDPKGHPAPLGPATLARWQEPEP